MRLLFMRRTQIVFTVVLVAVLIATGRATEPGASQTSSSAKTRNVLMVTADGLRWQEVFGGADPALLKKEDGGVQDVDLLRHEFVGGEPDNRRRILFPFLWDVIARNGQLFGNANAGSEAKVTNGKNFSYPGYNEIFTGAADPTINSKDKVPNRNVTVLEWLNAQENFQNRIAAFGSWSVFPFILNDRRSKIPVAAGWNPLSGVGQTSAELLLGRLMSETPRIWEDCCYDTFTFHVALEYSKRQRPRVLYIGLGETDEFAHMGRYDQYLHAANRFDTHLRILWKTLQSLPDYRGTTTLIVTTDHGRGDAPVEWKSHGAQVNGSERNWIGVLGPDTPALGERTNVPLVTQSQVAATLANFLGFDYRAAAPKAAPPIKDVFIR